MLSVLIFLISYYYTEYDKVWAQSINNTLITPQHEYVQPINFPYLIFASIGIIGGLTVIVILIIGKYKKRDHNKSIFRFLEIIRDGDYYPSLPRFQFLIWTLVIAFVYLSIYLIRIYSGKFDAPFIDNNLLILLGISISSPLISNVISGYKYSKRLNGVESTEIDYSNREFSFRSMLFENGKPALFRYQMFLWTFIGVFIFLSVFAGSLHIYTLNYIDCKESQKKSEPNSEAENPCQEIESLKMPTVDLMLVTLMGLSQSGYLGGKIVARTPSRIRAIFPTNNGRLVILGYNFGDKNENLNSGTILINGVVVAGHSDSDVKWFDTKIEFSLPQEYRNIPFQLGLVIDDHVFLFHDYKP